MFTLIGAYHPEGEPLDQRRLAIDVCRSGLRLSALVSVESIATGAPCSPLVTVEGVIVSYRFDFHDAEGTPYVLAVRQNLSRPTLRALTELTGAIGRAPGARIGPATLRVDYRR